MESPQQQQYNNMKSGQMQNDPYQQYQDENYGGGSTYGDTDPEFIRLQIDVEKDLDRFTQEVLRGMVEVVNSERGEKEWVPVAPGEKKPMNELGVRGLLILMKGAVTKISKLSCKTDDEIKQDMFYFHMSLVSHMYQNFDLWDMRFSDVEAIKEASLRLVWDVAASSRDGFTAINLRSQYSKQDISRTDDSNKQGRSFLGIPIGKR